MRLGHSAVRGSSLFAPGLDEDTVNGTADTLVSRVYFPGSLMSIVRVSVRERSILPGEDTEALTASSGKFGHVAKRLAHALAIPITLKLKHRQEIVGIETG